MFSYLKEVSLSKLDNLKVINSVHSLTRYFSSNVIKKLVKEVSKRKI